MTVSSRKLSCESPTFIVSLSLRIEEVEGV